MDQFLIFFDLGGVSNFDSIKISGAMISSFATMYPNKEGILSSDFEMHITDAFPVCSGSPYLPAPTLPYITFRPGTTLAERMKLMKSRKRKTLHVTLSTARQIAKLYAESDYTSVFIGDVDFTQEQIDSIAIEEEIPGVKIDPINKESEIYSKEIKRYAENSKLWIHVCTPLDEMLVAISQLQDVGISSRRSSGLGKFRLKGAKFDVSMGYTEPGLYLLLSPFIPNSDDMENIDFVRSSYTISLFSGNDRDGRPLGVFKYFETGSVFYLEKRVNGTWVRPEKGKKRMLNFTGSFMRLGK